MAKKIKSTFLTMTGILFIVALISSSLLSLVYKVTKDPIAKAEQEKKENAIKIVVPKFDNSPFKEVYKIASLDGDSLTCFPATKDGELVGVAIETYTDKGFSGKFTVMVGFLPDGTIYNSAVLSHMETPGLGDKMSITKSDWCEQFYELNVPEINDKDKDDIFIEVTKDGGEVDAITAATISSRAYCDALERAYDAYMNQK